ncbi:hypothetical protein LCGC14_0392400 [marine sediment metagenome]|uniref:Uncharacterized protein n=1 Tax=marine sediment metagenome TaxID=412755 RepID=A0A0F9VLF4_9ZZZZ
MSKIVSGILVHDRSDVGPRRIKNRDVELTDVEKDAVVAEWNANEVRGVAQRLEDEREKKIKARVARNARDQAITELTEEGTI